MKKLLLVFALIGTMGAASAQMETVKDSVPIVKLMGKSLVVENHFNMVVHELTVLAEHIEDMSNKHDKLMIENQMLKMYMKHSRMVISTRQMEKLDKMIMMELKATTDDTRN